MALNLHFIAILTNLNAGKESDLKRGPLCLRHSVLRGAFLSFLSGGLAYRHNSPSSFLKARVGASESCESWHLRVSSEHGRRRAAVCRAARARVVTSVDARDYREERR